MPENQITRCMDVLKKIIERHEALTRNCDWNIKDPLIEEAQQLLSDLKNELLVT